MIKTVEMRTSRKIMSINMDGAHMECAEFNLELQIDSSKKAVE